jgi:dihydroorotate dehydrogenase electron transfer subunit
MPVPVDTEAEVLNNTRLSPDYCVLALAAPAVAAAARPGQFVMVRTAAGTDPLLRRPLSIFEVLRRPDGEPYAVSLLIKRLGPGTARLYGAAAGDRFGCLGPLGRPFTVATPPCEAWMVAGGVGLAPFATLADALREAGTTAVLYYGGRTADDVFYVDWFARRGVRVVLTTEDGSRGEHGRVTAPVARDLGARPAGEPVMLYACGPEAMLHAVASLATEHGRPSEVSTERIMGCGLGGCYSCVVRVRGASGSTYYVRSCVDGPVFNGEHIVWE